MYLKGEVLPEDSQYTRTNFWIRYNSATKLVWRWFKTLLETDKQVYQQFVLPEVNYELVSSLVKRSYVEQQQQQIRKEETDALMYKFPELRALAHGRYNKIARLREKWYSE